MESTNELFESTKEIQRSVNMFSKLIGTDEEGQPEGTITTRDSDDNLMVIAKGSTALLVRAMMTTIKIDNKIVNKFLGLVHSISSKQVSECDCKSCNQKETFKNFKAGDEDVSDDNKQQSNDVQTGTGQDSQEKED